MANRKNTFLIKRSNVPGNKPTAGQILLGELALNTADVILYTSGTTANSILPIGWDRVSKTGDTMTGPLYSPTISATTYLNLPITADIRVTGGTHSNGTATFTNNTGGTFNVTGFSTGGGSSTILTGGTFNNGVAVYTNNSGGTFNVTGFTSSNIPVKSELGSSFSKLQDFIDVGWSAGRISGGELVNNGNGTVNILLGSGMIKTTDNILGNTNFFSWNTQNNISLVNEQTSYLYVDYNGGLPLITATTDSLSVTQTTQFILASVYRKNNDIYTAQTGTEISNLPRKIQRRLTEAFGYQRTSGIITSETGTLGFKVSTGIIWSSLNRNIFPPFSTISGGTFTLFTRNGVGGFNELASQTTLDPNIYDNDGTTPQLTNGRYSSYFVYVGTGGKVDVLMGQTNTTLSLTQSSVVPANLPKVMNDFSLFAAKIIILKGANTFTEVQLPYGTLVSQGSTNNHNELSSLQGGSVGEYYHLTSNDYNTVLGVNTSLQQKANLTGATFTGGVSATTISATTYLNLPITADIRVTGGTHSNGTATFTNNTGGTFNVTGFSTGGGGSSTFTGGTVSGATQFTGGLTANTISATTYLNLPITTDIRVTGGTYSNGTTLFTNNTGGTFNITGFTTNTYGDLRQKNTVTTTGTSQTLLGIITGITIGTYIIESYVTANKSNNEYGVWKRTLGVTTSGGTPVIVHENADLDKVSSGFTGNTIVYSAITGNAINIYVTGISANTYNWASYYNIIDQGIAANNILTLSTNISASTIVVGAITATNYLGLPTDIRVTGGTHSNGTATFTNNTGGTFNVTGFSTGGTGSVSPITIVNTSSLFSTGLANTGNGSIGVDSLFFGRSAGNGATNASNSNFFGFSAGQNAINANNSNFIGAQAGQEATNATYSNFIGFQVGSATSAQFSNFFGFQTGNQATNASNSNFFGQNAGFQATTANDSNFFGYYAGNGATGASFSNFIGQSAGDSASSATGSNFIGHNAGQFSIGASQSNFIGYQAGVLATNASGSTFIGSQAGRSATGASYSTLIGFNVGNGANLKSIGSNNIIIGTNISLVSGKTNSINLGGVLFGTGVYSTITGNPSITPQTQGKIGVNIIDPIQAFEVSGGTRLYGGLTATTISATTYLNLPSTGGGLSFGQLYAITTLNI